MKNRILVIEDDTAISELISMNLTVAGYDTEALFDGNEVEELLNCLLYTYPSPRDH